MELYFAPLACSMSARIALNEAGGAVKLVEVDTHAGRTLVTGGDYRAINPLGYVPALKLDDGTVLTENAAILQYIADQYPEAELAPPPSDRRGRAKLKAMAELHRDRIAQGAVHPAARREDAARGEAVDIKQIPPRASPTSTPG